MTTVLPELVAVLAGFSGVILLSFVVLLGMFVILDLLVAQLWGVLERRVRGETLCAVLECPELREVLEVVPAPDVVPAREGICKVSGKCSLLHPDSGLLSGSLSPCLSDCKM